MGPPSPSAMYNNHARHRVSAGLLMALSMSILLVWIWRCAYTTTASKGLSSISVSYDSLITVTQDKTTDPSAADDRPLITYVYSESPEARRNLKFFLAHGLHSEADFVFIFNGETDADSLLPDTPGIRSVRRGNTCYDLGSHAEVLLKDSLWRRYKRFILMNASVRGPFMPAWADGLCWTERLLSKITHEVKVRHKAEPVSSAASVYIGVAGSMVWATDSEGLSLLLRPPPGSPRHDEWMETLFSHANDFPRPEGYKPSGPNWVEKGLSQCFANRQDAVVGEIAATGIIVGAGKKVDTLLTAYQTSKGHNSTAFCEPLGAWDPQSEGNYGGGSIHPLETMFIKTNRGLSPALIESFTDWTDSMGYSSFKQC